MATRLALLFAGVALVVGCASTPKSGGDNAAAAFAPLAVGHSWSYKVTPGPDEPQTVKIVSRDDKGYFVDDKGGRMAPRSDGIYDGQRFLLLEPLAVGTKWSAVVPAGPQAPVGAPGVTEHYEIIATDAVVTVPAGTFNDCIEVQAKQSVTDPTSGKPATLLMQWTWAKNAGLIRVRQSARIDGNKEPVATATMELIAFHPATP